MYPDKETYLRILDNKPFKLSAEEAKYRKSEGEEECQGCVHFFNRKVDGFAVCEVVRPEIEEEEQAIIPNYVCKFWNDDLENYPLLPE